jgi:hypothetical protein
MRTSWHTLLPRSFIPVKVVHGAQPLQITVELANSRHFFTGGGVLDEGLEYLLCERMH